MVWKAGKLNVGTIQSVNDDGVPHPDPLYQGWYYRPWDSQTAWEYFRFTSNGELEVHHFNVGFSKTSPLGSSNFCCSSLSVGGSACNQGNVPHNNFNIQ